MYPKFAGCLQTGIIPKVGTKNSDAYNYRPMGYVVATTTKEPEEIQRDKNVSGHIAASFSIGWSLCTFNKNNFFL